MDDGVDTVGVDIAFGFALATAHLIAQGHTRIAFAGKRKGHAVANQRRMGYVSTMKEARASCCRRADYRRRTHATGAEGGAGDL
ncbi:MULTISPECIES: hypothetical protein [unclassified Caballeronia]|uniref:hypothetical protein n=1 Tax=unclassified Caballeronia TaxID=2646786 RepID=UPI003857F3EF